MGIDRNVVNMPVAIKNLFPIASAVFREIDFLSAKPEESATPGWRDLDVGEGLRYFLDNKVPLQPTTPVAAYQLARTAYWLGRTAIIVGVVALLTLGGSVVASFVPGAGR